ncbi:hypothetical protein B620_gp27 [Croceibacter phage P2559S]|uniref:hypothetical protein n=1 Tax=Croceibacter phage P2559S TaxID=1176422 RepID=UPI0002688EB6|nr:hypothetical protein B620_gp27 [Croceibacter phage P2559S]AFM54805.1 hypothetical protein P2559S_27 [Croceibacter phage P2559S]
MQDQYQNKINELRQERETCRKAFSVITDDIETMLNAFAVDDGVTLITWKELHKAVMGETYFVNKKVKFIKTYEDKKKMRFKTYMAAGGSFGLQEHDVLEKVFIHSGHLIEATRGDKIYEKNETVIYAANEKHKPKALVESVYDVTFIKQKL